MVTERQRGAQAALFSSVRDLHDATPSGEHAEAVDERRHLVDRLRERWSLVQQLGEYS